MVYLPGEQIAPEETIEVYTQILKKSKEKKKKKCCFTVTWTCTGLHQLFASLFPGLGLK